MSDRITTIYIWITMLVTIGVIAVMLLIGDPNKHANEENPVQTAETSPSEATDSEHVFYEWSKELAENSMHIYLPSEIGQQHVIINNDYRNKKIQISIAKQPEGTLSQAYFYDHPMLMHATAQEVKLSESAEQIELEFVFESMFEWEMKLEKGNGQNCLYLQLIRPRDKYEKIVVLDAGHGGEDAGYMISGEDEATILQEKQLVASVVEKAGKLLEKEGICVYYTRQGDENPTQQQRVELANETQADMLISVHADYSDDTSLYGMRTIYNETYFIPNFASADLAYLLLEKVAASTNEKAIGFEPGTNEAELIQNAMVPVAQLYIGYLSNKQEQKLLSREDYIDRIANGVYDAVMASYEEMEK